jgi:AraC-like DNA-binding protein
VVAHAVFLPDILRQMSPGPFHGRIEYVELNGLLIYREHWTRRILATGATPEGYFVFGGSLSPRNSVDWCGGEANSRQLAFGRPSSEVDMVFPHQSHHAALLVPEDLMLHYFGEESIAAALSSNRHHLGCNEQPGCDLIARIDRVVSKYLANAGLLADARECKAVESQLMNDLAGSFPDGNAQDHRITPTQRRKAFRRAIEFGEGLCEPITVPEYAAVTGVSQRTLELTFQETLGITPRQYLRWHRQHRVHCDLRAKDAGASTVSAIAAGWGFSEMGRFAVEYKRLFGESPSVTLRSRKTPPPKRLSDIL